MKKIAFLTAVLLMGVVLNLKAQDETNDSYKLVIAPVLDGVEVGADGLIVVTKDKKKGVISHDGKKVIVPVIYDDVYVGKEGDNCGDVIVVMNKLKGDFKEYGIYHKDGVVLFKPQICEAMWISGSDAGGKHYGCEGLVGVSILERIEYDTTHLMRYQTIENEIIERRITKDGVFLENGTLLNSYDKIDIRRGGLMVVAKDASSSNKKEGVLNKKGEIIIPIEYHSFDMYNELFIIANNIDGKTCVFDNNGNVIVPVGKYDFVQINGNYIEVNKNGKGGVLNSKGIEIVPIGMYSRCYIGECELDEKQKYIEVDSNGKKGVLNDNGKAFIPIGRYEKYKVLTKNIAEVMLNGKMGIINNNGILIVPIGKYDKLLYRYGMIIYTKNGKFGVLGKDGNEVTMAEYDKIEPQRHSIGMAVVRKDDKIGVINCDGKIIVPLGNYNDCRVNEEIGLAVSDEGTMFFDRNGKILAPIGKLERCLKQYDINRMYPLNSNNSEVGLFYFNKNEKYGIMRLW